MKTTKWALVGVCVLLAACSTVSNLFTRNPSATAVLAPTKGNSVSGTVNFTQKGAVVLVEAKITGLPANGTHGFHIHEKGNCSAADASSAGAHFNPTNKHHGGPMTAEHHEGDLGNIETDASGKTHLDWKGKLSLSGADSIIGKSVVVHEKEDDLKTDPSGNSGARVACGAIEAAK